MPSWYAVFYARRRICYDIMPYGNILYRRSGYILYIMSSWNLWIYNWSYNCHLLREMCGWILLP